MHFELLPGMSTRNFVLAFQRFCNMYCIPQYLYSDNAKTFIKGGNILETSLQSKEFQDEMEKCEIKHIRIPLYSAWIGAAWERLIRVLKGCLYKVIRRARLTYFELLTTLSNVKLAVNSRPLTYRASTPIIAPNSFLRLYSNSSLVLRKSEEDVWRGEQDSSTLDKTLNIQEEILNNFKSMWYVENFQHFSPPERKRISITIRHCVVLKSYCKNVKLNIYVSATNRPSVVSYSEF